jgi:antitoxin ParD1/3/4
MAKVVKRTFSLTEEQAKFIDEKVEAGRYASGSEVVREGLRGLQDDDAVIEEWLRREVLPAIEEVEAHPERVRPANEVFEEILSEMREKPAPRKRA